MKSFILFSVTISMFAFSLQAQITYVDQDASGSNDGSSWVDAYTELQDALTIAQANDTIWVAAGTYKTTTGTNRDISFVIPDSVMVFGGFSGTESPSFNLNLRNFETNETILSGDIGIQGNDIDNSFHVVRTNYVSPATLLDGFTIAYGNADDGNITIPDVLGGGFFNNAEGTGNSSNPTVKNCIFRDNYAISGGGFYNFGNGGAAKSTIFNCKFISNSSRSGGGILNNARIGGEATATVINSVFYNNTAEWDGGGVMNFSRGSSPNHSKYINCTFVNNTADLNGDDIFNEEKDNGNTDIEVVNTIIVNTTSGAIPIVNDGNINFSISYSLAKGNSCIDLGTTISCGAGMVYDASFSFVGEIQGDFRTSFTSSARNSGLASANTTSYDLIGRERVVGTGIDIGAIEGLTHVFVDSSNTQNQNGASWNSAFKDLQDALKEGSKIWVAKGIYFPTNTLSRSARFVQNQGVELIGGFQGNEDVNTFDLDQRDFIHNEVILSGNIGDPTDSLDNSYSILRTISSDLDKARIDGFTIAGAYREKNAFSLGKEGALTSEGSFEVINCVFKSNYSSHDVGGIYVSRSGNSASPLIKDCTFYNNYAANGSAIFCDNGTNLQIENVSFLSNKSTNGTVFISNPTLTGVKISDCTFEKNNATSAGAIGVRMLGSSGSLFISRTTFIANTAFFGSGGALQLSSDEGNLNAYLSNCKFINNQSHNGGAIYVWGSTGAPVSELYVTNSLFFDNKAGIDGGGIYGRRLNSFIKNAIFWGNIDALLGEDNPEGTLNSWVNEVDSHTTLSNSIVEEDSCSLLSDATCVSGNLFDMYPLFVDTTNNNFELQATSPAIDIGTRDIGFVDDINGQRHINEPDAGAHEFPCSSIQNINLVPTIINELNSQVALQTLQANNTINPTSNVYYQAGENIILNPGFEAKSGNVFEAVVDNGCN